jgi:hypothetical protein
MSNHVYEFGDIDEYEDVSWLEHATSLRNLQALDINCPRDAAPLIGNLTGLTGLTWLDSSHTDHEACSIMPLTRLTRLRSLELDLDMSERDLRMACTLGLGSLTSLRLWDS